jgi:hypothetical protein
MTIRAHLPFAIILVVASSIPAEQGIGAGKSLIAAVLSSK